MASLFTRIIEGDAPARFVWKDEQCVAFLALHPLKPGHTLVVPRVEVDHWIDLDAALMSRLVHVAQIIGTAQRAAFRPEKVALMIAGLEVRHVHLHLVPIGDLREMDFGRADRDPDPVALDEAAARLRAALLDQGRTEVHGA